jgi:hypothetical protein
MRGHNWLDGFLGFELIIFTFDVKDGLIAVKFSRLTWVECWPFPVFACYSLAFALQLREKAWKTLSQGSRQLLGDVFP